MLPGYLAADYKNPLHRSEKMDRLDDVAIHEIEWYNVANDLILDQLSSRIRATAMTGSWRSVQHFQFAWASCWPPARHDNARPRGRTLLGGGQRPIWLTLARDDRFWHPSRLLFHLLSPLQVERVMSNIRQGKRRVGRATRWGARSRVVCRRRARICPSASDSISRIGRPENKIDRLPSSCVRPRSRVNGG